MGYFRFRKTIGILPGVRLNLSKTGVSTSLGGPGASLNVGRGQRNVTVGVPGTGMSYRTPATTSLFLALLVVAGVIAIAWYFQPELVRQMLHWWQPKWF
jgi:hypothetical protein